MRSLRPSGKASSQVLLLKVATKVVEIINQKTQEWKDIITNGNGNNGKASNGSSTNLSMNGEPLVNITTDSMSLMFTTDTNATHIMDDGDTLEIIFEKVNTILMLLSFPKDAVNGASVIKFKSLVEEPRRIFMYTLSERHL